MAKNRFTAPVGRMVQGSVDEPQTKDAQGALRVVKTGPNAGQPNPQYFIGVAYPKADPQGEFGQFYGMLVAQAAADFPALFPNAPRGDFTCVHPQFSFKVIDGDGLDQNGKPNSTKEGFAGHWVVRYASAYPPRCFHAGRYAPNEQIQEKGAIKRGYFVRVSGTVEGNGNVQRPGLYVNLDLVELSAYGPEIVSGPDASQAFATPGALPAGASATPLTPPATPAAPGAPAVPPTQPLVAGAPATPPYTGYMAPGAPTTGAPVAASPGLPATPSSAPPAIPSPTSVAPPPPPAAPTGPVMLPPAQGATYEQMIAAGWTDVTLRQHGMMA